jgi:hypothetical protein
VRTALQFGTIRNRIGVVDHDRRVKAWLEFPFQFLRTLPESIQREQLEMFLVHVNIEVAVRHENRVSWMVVPCVKRFELIVGQLGDFRRVAAAVELVDSVVENGTAQLLPELCRRSTHGALHLVVHRILVGCNEIDAPPFLREIKRIERGKEYRVEINCK